MQERVLNGCMSPKNKVAVGATEASKQATKLNWKQVGNACTTVGQP